MRDDIFIIWGNGLQHIEEILDLIREEYTIYFIQRHSIENMETFIKEVYACDTVPWKHLVKKSKYLLKAPKACFTVYVENPNPQERYYGEGAFRHIQCARIKATKEKIRNLFNPKTQKGKRTEEHVIHGTDYSSQVEYLSKYFQIPSKKTRYPKLIKCKPLELNLEELYCNILGKGIIRIKESPHFKYLQGEHEEYRRYILKYLGTSLTHDHLPGAYDRLIKDFKPGLAKGIIIRKRKDKLVLIDGVHRACIFLNRGTKQVKGYQC